MTSAPTIGWSSARVLAPFLISVFGFAGFFLYEAYVSAERAAIPPKTWFLPNFSVLFGSALFPNLWFVTVFGIFSAYWQGIWGWSPISTAVHL